MVQKQGGARTGRDGTPGRGFPRSAVRIFCVRGEEDLDGTPPFQERGEVTSISAWQKP